MATSEEIEKYCRNCVSRDFVNGKGLVCKRTGELPAFEEECDSFEQDKELERLAPPKPEDFPVFMTEEEMLAEENLPKGILCAVVACIVGAVAWGLISVSTGRQIGFMPIAIGFMVGFAMRQGKGIRPIFGITGAALSLVSCILGDFLSIIGYISQDYEMGYFQVLAGVDYGEIFSILLKNVMSMTALFYGFALIFEEEFLLSFFNDPAFLRNLSYFHTERRSSKLSLDKKAYGRISELISEIDKEIKDYQSKDKHLLRALLYETLMLLNRLYSNSSVLPPDTNVRSKSIYVDRFIELVNHSFKRDHSIRSYADQLCITPNYLNEIVKNATGINAKQYILNKILIESKRLLTYTDLPISAITEALGYEDPSYFIRLFRSQTNMTPLNYRRNTKP